MQLRFSQVHVTILNFVLIAALAIVSAMCVRDIIERSVAAEPETSSTASFVPKIPSGVRTRIYYDQIVKRDIFNAAPQESAPAPVVEADLNLKLIGTSIVSRAKPYAIIEDTDGNESLYRVGDSIPDAGTLVSVENTRAIIDRGGGNRVAIEIPTSDIPEVPPSELGSAAAVRPGVLRRNFPALLRNRLRGFGRHPPNMAGPNGAGADDDDSDNDNSDDSSGDDNSSAKIDLKKVGPGKFEVSRSEVQQSMENPAEFFSQMRAMPHFANGKTDGFSISQVTPGSVFAQLGLQNGDLLTNINGQAVTNPMQALGLMQAMRTQSAIDLTVNRGGTPTSVHLDMR